MMYRLRGFYFWFRDYYSPDLLAVRIIEVYNPIISDGRRIVTMDQNGHLLHAVEETYDRTQHGKKDEFSAFVEKKRKKLAELEGNRVTTRDLAARMGIEYEQFRKILNKQKPTKKRDFVIALCAVLEVNSEETNTALALYDMPPLNTEYPRDDELITILEEQLEMELSIEEINLRLVRNKHQPLVLIDRRGSEAENKIKYPFTLLRKRTECRTDELYYGDFYDSLQTEYQPDRYRIYSEMWLDDEDNRRGFKLTADLSDQFIREDYPLREGSIHVYHNLDETGEFRDCFIELKSMAKSELKTMASYLRDTKNYLERKSATIIDNCLHVYYETYNYTIPELGEYYLMDFSSGVFKLSISKESRFMRLYLPCDVYYKLYGKGDIPILEEYESVAAIETYYSGRPRDAMLMKYRINAYNKMKAELETFIQKLKNKEIHIRNTDQILDNRYAVLQFFGVADAFDCEYDEEYGFITNAKKETATFTVPPRRRSPIDGNGF